MKKFLLSAGLMISALLVLTGCEQAPQQTHLTGSTMGTYYSVKYVSEMELPASSDIQAEIDARLELVNDQMSTYRKDSELSLFNQQKGSEPFTVSKDTAKVVAEAIRLNLLSDGALDVTVGPLVNLWGFGPEGRPDRVPTDEQIEERRAMTGIEFLSVEGNNLIKTNPGLYVDLSSIAKGFGVDVVANYLASLGIDNYLVEIGGELQLKGKNAEGQPWRIAIEKPTSEQQTVQEIIAPGDMAIATSGDYRNYFEENGVRYSHTINPATAKPINHRLVSVTVLDKSCMTADGLSTAFMVMGPDAALALANQENIPAFFIVKTDNGFNEVASDAFKPYLTR
ncbi:thiamine biosynthesis lipoprotein [Grimontia sp. AD028]|uniref:FAD:protein FMN transferase n=1 Tax=Grimontia sp. AD028 TaxID=1581149 RepID=UPI00061ABC04|nr:FAD:protein FMN transferase [Grimontia sp. AD028]KKD57923.1 thiamine biosynthesis lipoprotein [Grimontia sp. AD028]